MQRRNLLSALLATAVLSSCSASRTSMTTGSVTVGGMSARTARDLARVHGMLGKLALSPEMRRNLQPGSPLPEGIVFHDMPAGMVNALPKVEGHEWRAAGIDLVLVDTNTRVVADILRGPLR